MGAEKKSESARSRQTDPLARISLLVLYGGALILLYLILVPFLTGIFWAGFLVVTLYPAYRWLVKQTKGKEMGSSLLLTLVVAAVVIVPTILVILSLADSIQETIPNASEFLEKLKTTLGNRLPAGFDIQAKGMELLSKVGQFVASHTAPMVQNIFGTLFTVLVTFIMMLVLFKEGPRVLAIVRSAIPLKEGDCDKILVRLHEVARAIFFGVIVTAAVQAFLGTIGWMFVGLSEPLTAAILMFVSALIPAPGTIIVWGPAAFYLYLKGDTLDAVILAAWGFLIVGMVDNFLKPIFISGAGKIHMLLVFFGMIGGLQAFGFSGLFLGPLIIIASLELIKIVRRDFYSKP